MALAEHQLQISSFLWPGWRWKKEDAAQGLESNTVELSSPPTQHCKQIYTRNTVTSQGISECKEEVQLRWNVTWEPFYYLLCHDYLFKFLFIDRSLSLPLDNHDWQHVILITLWKKQKRRHWGGQGLYCHNKDTWPISPNQQQKCWWLGPEVIGVCLLLPLSEPKVKFKVW